MDSQVSKIMTKALWTALENDSLENVEALMSRHHLSSVPVVDPHGRIFGIISNSDLLRFRESHGNTKSAHAWELCTYRPIEVGPAMSVRDAAQLMVKHRIHHVVVTEGLKVVGFVSALDIVEQYLLQASAR